MAEVNQPEVVEDGEAVTVSVSTGPQKVNVTNVIGRTAQQAHQTLQAAGFQVQSQGLRNGFVLWYNPSGPAPRAALSPCTPGS